MPHYSLSRPGCSLLRPWEPLFRPNCPLSCPTILCHGHDRLVTPLGPFMPQGPLLWSLLLISWSSCLFKWFFRSMDGSFNIFLDSLILALSFWFFSIWARSQPPEVTCLEISWKWSNFNCSKFTKFAVSKLFQPFYRKQREIRLFYRINVINWEKIVLISSI